MSSLTDLDTGPLTWVKGEIDLALGRATEAIEAADKDQDRSNNLQFAQTHLHQVRGALSIVGLDGLTSFADALDRLLAELARGDREYQPELGDLARRALAGIGNYLDELSHGVPDQALRLLPLLGELASARGQARPSPAELFYPDLGQRPSRKASPVPPDAAKTLAARIRPLRAKFQGGLLSWIRTPDDAAGPLAMHAVSTEVESLQTTPTARSFWWAASAFFETLSKGGASGDPAAKRLCSRIDQQLKRMAGGQNAPSEALHRELLYVIATLPAPSAAAQEVCETYDLKQLMPEAGATLCDQPLAPLLSRLRSLFAEARDTWDHFASGAAAALPQFDKDLQAAIRASAPLGRPSFQHLLDTLAEVIEWLRKDPLRINDQLALEVASAVMLAETALETGRVPDASFTAQVSRSESRLAALMTGEDPDQERSEQSDLPDAARQAQERMALGQLAREMQVNLAHIEQTLDDYFRHPDRKAALPALDAPLQQIEGVLTVLGEDRALEVLKDCETRIKALSDSDQAPPDGEFEYLAHHLSAFGFYVEELQGGNADLDRLLKGIEEGASEAEEVSAETQEAEPIAPQPIEEPAADEVVPAAAEAADADASDADEAPTPGEAPAEEADEATASVPPTAAPVPPPPSPELLESSDAEIDSELLEIFIEEGREVVDTIGDSLAKSRSNPHDTELVTTIRRGFHTLKGSGRMVGLTDLGEAAWGMEQTLNRWLQLEWEPTPALYELVDGAHGLFDAWVEQLASGGGLNRDATSLLAEAQRLRESEQPIEDSALHEPQAAPAAEETPAETDVADASAAAEPVEASLSDMVADLPQSSDLDLEPAAPQAAEAAEGAEAEAADVPDTPAIDGFPLEDDTDDALRETALDLADLTSEPGDDGVLPIGAIDELEGFDGVETSLEGLEYSEDSTPDEAPEGTPEPAADLDLEATADEAPAAPAAEESAEAPAEAPVVEALSEEPAAEAPAEEPTAEALAEEPVAETIALPEASDADEKFDLDIDVDGLPEGIEPHETGAEVAASEAPADDAETVIDIDFGDIETDEGVTLSADDEAADLDIDIDIDAPETSDADSADREPAADSVVEDEAGPDEISDIDFGDLGDGEAPDAALAAEATEAPTADEVTAPAAEDDEAGEAASADGGAGAIAAGAAAIAGAALATEALEEAEQPATEIVEDLGVLDDFDGEAEQDYEAADELDDSTLESEEAELGALEQEAVAAVSAQAAEEEEEPDFVCLGENTISRPLFDLYLAEAMQHLTTLKRELGHLEINPTLLPADPSIRAAHTLAGISGTAHVEAIQQIAKSLEHAQARFRDAEQAPAAEQTDLLSRSVTTLEAMLVEVGRETLPLEVPELVAQLDALLRADGATQDASTPEEATPPQPEEKAEAHAAPVLQDEYDEQLLPIFLEEAAELLEQLQGQLRDWRAAPEASEPTAVIARLLHTFKGSARMAGAMRLGEFMHGLETRLQESDDAPAVLIDELEAGLDSASETLDEIALGPAPAPEPEPAAAPTQERRHEPRHAPMVPDLESPGSSASLRVRADLVDKFVNEAGEIGIARTRIDGELRTLRRSLLDLTENVIRLRNQLREIELQAETQLQSRIALSSGAEGEFDPLELDRFTRLQELTRMMAESVNDVTTVQHNLLKNLDGAEGALSSQARLNRDLQQALMRVRMVPFDSIADRVHRVVRQSSKDMGKRVTLDIQGGSTEIDRSVLERMTAPLEHLLRNSIAHGIEEPEARAASGKAEIGQIVLKVAQEGNEVAIELADDGAGLNFERIRQRALDNGLIQADEEVDDKRLTNMIFMPGFSTATSLSTVSGRGVGMDVVKSETAAVGGRIDISSDAGTGTRFRIYLPVNLAVTQALLVSAGPRTYAIPSTMVAQVRELRAEELATLRSDRQVEWNEQIYEYRYLPRLVGDGESQPEVQRFNWVLLLRAGDQHVALHVDGLRGNQEIVVKNAGPHIARIVGISGATVMGDGEIVLILNPVALAGRPDVIPEDGSGQVVAAKPATHVPTVMVVDDSLTVRKIAGRLLEREGYKVVTAKDGVDALERLIEVVPDVVLSDIEMPRMDGFDLARNIRNDQRLKDLPIIMITSRLAEKHKEYARDIGVNHYLGKPYDEQELLGHIATYAPLHAA